MIVLPQGPGPAEHVSVTGSLEGWDAVALLLVLGAVVAVILWPLIRALARRIEQGGAGAETEMELETLRERVRVLEEMQPRMTELEERVEFAERVLVRGQESPEPGRLRER
ncbi:MAG TPA: hypothetical protein VJQ44_11810 [Gemmatimonadales bacterium]|nr:hypothetical protein [Gemmatimonadales bacterium]